MRTLARRPSSGWALKCLLVNACAAALDWSMVFLLAGAWKAPTPVATCTGLALGASFSFLMNRRFAFQAQGQGRFAHQALRYAAGTACLMVLHAAAASWLVDTVGLPLAAGKLLADMGVLAGGQLLVLRYLVFPVPRATQPRAVPLRRPVTVG